MIDNMNHIYASTSKHTIEAAIVTTKTTINTLNLSLVICPSRSAMSVHVSFKMSIWWSSKRIKILFMPVFVNVVSYPVLAGFVRRIGVTDE